MADFKGRKRGKSHVQNMGIFFLVAQDMVLSHCAKFQLIINFFRVKAISTGLHGFLGFIYIAIVQIFHYSRWITPKRVTSWRGPSPRQCARATQLRTFEEMSQRWRAVGSTVSDLTGPRFEPQTSRSRDECVTARPTGRYIANVDLSNIAIVELSNLTEQVNFVPMNKGKNKRG